MKKSWRWLSMLMVMILMITVIPIIPETVEVKAAENEIETVSQVSLTYNEEVLDLNVAWTEGEVNKRALKNCFVETEGLTYDAGNSGLRFRNGNSMNGIGGGTNQVDSQKEYALCYHLEIKSSETYNWADGVKSCKSDTEITGIDGFTVEVNGIKRDDVLIKYNEYWNSCKVYVPIGTASTEKIVTTVTISENDLALEKGGTHTFGGQVSGTVSDNSIDWSVEGALSNDTTIDENGKLFIGEDESAETLTVKASAHADHTKFAAITVTVLEEAPYIKSVSVNSIQSELYTGQTMEFTATVTGTQTDKSVIWSVEGNTSPNTTITNTGFLKVGADEMAETLTVKATACKDDSKVGKSTIKIKQKNRISQINLSYDMDVIRLTTAYTEGEVNSRARNNLGTNTEGLQYDAGNSGLMFWNEGVMYGIGGGTNQVDDTKEYVLCINLEWSNSCGCDWAVQIQQCVNNTEISELEGVSVFVNGVEREDVIIQYNETWNCCKFFVPVGKAKCGTVPVLTAQKDATCKNEGKKAYYYCGDCDTYYEDLEKNKKIDNITTWGIISKLTTHTYNGGVVTKQPTETEAGVKSYICVVCGAIKTEGIPATGKKEEKPKTPVEPQKPQAPAKNTTLTDIKTGIRYKVTKAGTSGGTVELKAPKNKKVKKVTIPSTVKIDGITYKVTSISKNAFKGCSKLTTVTIGKNITKIGASAFSGCKKLKNITIKTTKLKSKTVGSKAFKGTPKNAKVKVPKSSLKAYKKFLYKKGLHKNAKITK